MKRQKSILIVEDDKDLINYIHDMLDPIYEEVICCCSALEAKQYVRDREFSLILSDIMMPGMAGYDFVTFIRSIGRIEPVIFVTGNASREILLTAIRLGVSDIIEKPFKETTLLQSIERTLEIDKRRYILYENIIFNQSNFSQSSNQKKMIGLLHVINSKK